MTGIGPGLIIMGSNLIEHRIQHGPHARYVNVWFAHAPGMPGTFSTTPTCIVTRAWRTCRDACRDRKLTVSFEVGGGENAPDIPGGCSTLNFTKLSRGPLQLLRYAILPTYELTKTTHKSLSLVNYQLRRYLPCTVLSRWRTRLSVNVQFSSIAVASRGRGNDWVCTWVEKVRRNVSEYWYSRGTACKGCTGR